MPTITKVKKDTLTEIVIAALDNSKKELYNELLGCLVLQLEEGSGERLITANVRQVLKLAVAEAVRKELVNREAKEEGIMHTLLQTADDKMLKPAAKVINPWLNENVIVKAKKHKLLYGNTLLQIDILPLEQQWTSILLAVLDPGIDLGILKDAA